jgi:hypothetical protein
MVFPVGGQLSIGCEKCHPFGAHLPRALTARVSSHVGLKVGQDPAQDVETFGQQLVADGQRGQET